jgi:hypothetical protein
MRKVKTQTGAPSYRALCDGVGFHKGQQEFQERPWCGTGSALFYELGCVDFGGEVGDIKDLANFGLAIAGYF